MAEFLILNFTDNKQNKIMTIAEDLYLTDLSLSVNLARN